MEALGAGSFQGSFVGPKEIPHRTVALPVGQDLGGLMISDPEYLEKGLSGPARRSLPE